VKRLLFVLKRLLVAPELHVLLAALLLFRIALLGGMAEAGE
jgi:hypothetical protein